MPLNTDHPHRRSMRLKGYNYSQPNAYYVTILTHSRECLFGEILNGKMQLNEIGTFVLQSWTAIPEHHSHADLDEFVIMPNHLHGIIVLIDNTHVDGIRRGVQLNAPTDSIHSRERNNPFSVISPERHSLGVIVRTFKAAVTTACRGLNRYDFRWQRNYYDHIVRNEFDLERVRQYIFNNPLNWESDTENPLHKP